MKGGINDNNADSLGEQIAGKERCEKLEKEIARLEKLARAEKQPKKKFELVSKIKELNKEILDCEKYKIVKKKG